jgi:O-antigen/teichoic acid export membrane protein
MLGAAGFIQTTFLYSRGRNMAVTGVAAVQGIALAIGSVILVKHIGLDGYGVAWLLTLVNLVFADHIVRKMFRFSYKRILPWVVVLSPPVLFPLVPIPWAFLLLAPVALVLLPPMRSEVRRIVRLIRSSMLDPPKGALLEPTP